MGGQVAGRIAPGGVALVVQHLGRRHVHALPAGFAQPVAEVDVLHVHEVALVEAADLARTRERRTNRHDPDSQPTGRSLGSSRSWRYARVHGLRGQTGPTTACMPPRTRLGRWRADGYTEPSGSRISGPSAPARGQRVAASSSASMLPGPHCTSGLATITQSSTQGWSDFVKVRDRAIHRGSVAEVGAGGEQPHVRIALDGHLWRSVGGAVVGQQHADRALGGQRQRGQEPLEVRARRVGHRYDRQDVSHA